MQENVRECVDTCIICTTSYQLMAAIAICEQLNRTTDLYIMGQFNDYDTIADKVSNENIFNNVYCVNEREVQKWRFNKKASKIGIHIREALIYLFPKRFVNRIIKNTKYKHILISTMNAFTGRIVSRYMMKHDKTELLLYDDGIGSYCDPEVKNHGRIEYILGCISFGRRVMNTIPNRFLYSPDLYRACNILPQNCKLYTIKRWNDNDMHIKALDRIFSYSVSDNVQGRVIAFESLERKTYPNDFDTIIQCYNYVAQMVNEDFCIKMHPRNFDDQEFYAQKYNIYQSKLSVPFELIINHSNVKNMILMSVSSTACFTPKILFDEEPIVLFLNKLISRVEGHISNQDNNLKFILALKKSYRDPSRVLIPENFESFKKMIDSVEYIS